MRGLRSQEDVAIAANIQTALVSNIENAKSANPRKRTIDALAKVLDITPEEIEACRTGSDASPLTNLHHTPTDYFVEIPEYTDALDAALLATNAAVIQAVQGMGGVGKTTLALHYAQRPDVIARYPVRWLVNAETDPGIRRDMAGLAAALDLADEQMPEAEAVQMATTWLSAPDRPALVIFDNAEEETFDRKWLPSRPDAAAALITTRQRDFAGVERQINIGTWSVDRATAFLLRRSGSGDEKGAEALAKALEGLALACEQAGAYCRASGDSPTAYLTLLNEAPERVLDWKRGAPDYPNSVAKTFTLAIAKAVADAPAAAAMLSVIAHLGTAPLPHAVFGHDGAPEGLRTNAEGAEARMALTRWGLIDPVVVTDEMRDAGVPAITIHRLTRLAVRMRAAEGELAQAVQAIGGAWPEDISDDLDTWPLGNALAPHMDVGWGAMKWDETTADAAGRALNQMALYEEYRTANYQNAQMFFEAALSLAEKTHGEDATQTATHLSNLSIVLRNLGGEANLTRAREALERALRIDEAAQGPDHPNVAIRLSNLSTVLYNLGGEANLTRAREALERALRIDEAAHGPDHPSVGIDCGLIARICVAIGGAENVVVARAMAERSVGIMERSMGADHPQTRIVRSIRDNEVGGAS